MTKVSEVAPALSKAGGNGAVDSGSPPALGSEISKTPLRLSLGSRDRVMPGWSNMDCDAHPGVDYVGDVANLSLFADNSISEIYASHIFEHFPHPKSTLVLKEWARTLKPNGILYIAVPDFERAAYLYLKTGMSPWLRNWICGDQGYPTAYHYSIYDVHSLKALLKEAGFVDITRVTSFPLDLHKEDCSQLVSTFDNKSVSLNLIAIKGAK